MHVFNTIKNIYLIVFITSQLERYLNIEMNYISIYQFKTFGGSIQNFYSF